MADPAHPPLIAALQNAALYDHPVAGFEVLETHISWVLLTGRYAYKIKKPVDLGFLDFSTLAQRRHYCEEEVRLNRRLAAPLYLGVVAITGSAQAPLLDGPGRAIEYAVRMAQFDRGRQFDRLLAAGRLTAELIDALADKVAAFHGASARAAPDGPYGASAQVAEPVVESLAQIETLLAGADERARVAVLRAWCAARHAALAGVLEGRRAEGFIRECHGDMHLANITVVDGAVLPFDCLEFSAPLRWIDIVSETAFLTMDLDAHGRSDLAFRFLNRYLEQCGDYASLALMPYYKVYRALVRAKVACIQGAQAGERTARRAELAARARAYLELAQGYTRPRAPALILTHGLSGSGKTTVGQGLIEAGRVIRLRSDVERKRLFGLAPLARSGSAPGGGLYDAQATHRTYARLAELAAAVLAAGYPVLVDATFLKHAQRAPFAALAGRLGVPFVVLELEAPEACLRERVRKRAAARRDASEADEAVLDYQLGAREAPSGEELDRVIRVASAEPVDAAALWRAVEDKVRGWVVGNG